jgi:uncharacterized membrane protein
VVVVALVVVGVMVVVVVSVVLVAVLADGEVAVELVAVEAAGVPPELPQPLATAAPSTTATSSRSVRFMRRCSGIDVRGPSWLGGHLFLRTGVRASIRDADMDRSEQLPQTHHPPSRNRCLGWLERHIPFWEPQLVVACTIALQLSLSNEVTLGPTWLLPAMEGALLIGLVIVSPRPRARHSPLRRRVAIGMIAFVSAANVVSLVMLSHQLLHGGKENGHQLILSGIVLWCTNVLLFGLWYWETDRGGPVAREKGERDFPDFLFPQMTDPQWAPKDWMPRLVDYLYVSLTNATAFSPTDTMPLTATAKWLMGAQSLVALVTVGLVVARAVNILS